jgi:hypothetical protein
VLTAGGNCTSAASPLRTALHCTALHRHSSPPCSANWSEHRPVTRSPSQSSTAATGPVADCGVPCTGLKLWPVASRQFNSNAYMDEQAERLCTLLKIGCPHVLPEAGQNRQQTVRSLTALGRLFVLFQRKCVICVCVDESIDWN